MNITIFHNINRISLTLSSAFVMSTEISHKAEWFRFICRLLTNLSLNTERIPLALTSRWLISHYPRHVWTERDSGGPGFKFVSLLRFSVVLFIPFREIPGENLNALTG